MAGNRGYRAAFLAPPAQHQQPLPPHRQAVYRTGWEWWCQCRPPLPTHPHHRTYSNNPYYRIGPNYIQIYHSFNQGQLWQERKRRINQPINKQPILVLKGSNLQMELWNFIVNDVSFLSAHSKRVNNCNSSPVNSGTACPSILSSVSLLEQN